MVSLAAGGQLFQRAGAQRSAGRGKPGGVQLKSLGRSFEDVESEVNRPPLMPVKRELFLAWRRDPGRY